MEYDDLFVGEHFQIEMHDGSLGAVYIKINEDVFQNAVELIGEYPGMIVSVSRHQKIKKVVLCIA